MGIQTLVVGMRERIERARPTIDPAIEVTYAEVQPLDALAPLLAAAEVLYPMSGLRVDEALLARAPRLRLVQVSSTGYDYIDLAAAARRGIPVCHVPGANALSVAEHVFLLMLALYRRLIPNHLGIVAGEYAAAKRRDMATGIYDLYGKTLGIVGFGRIGRQVARRAIPFELTTLYYDIVRPDPIEEQTYQVRYAPLPELLATVDILTVHVPLEPATYHLIGDAELALMKPSAIVINTARGPLVDPAALAARVADGRLAGAAVDVFEREPAPPDDPLVRLAASGCDRLVLTTHLAGVTHEAGQRSIQRAFDNIARLARGEPLQAVVNGVAAPRPAVAP
jgi:phosphoglycerate dehydrogenase-like enzyme